MFEGRIKPRSMSVQDAVLAMCRNDAGPIIACMELLKHGRRVDPDAGHPIRSLIQLDELGIYDGRIWILWNDVCGRDVVKMLAVLRASQLGELDAGELNCVIDNGGAGLDLDAIVEEVKRQLPRFDSAATIE